MSKKVIDQELRSEISEISGIKDDETLDKVITACLNFKSTRALDTKNNIGVLAKIAENLNLIVKVSNYGMYTDLNEDYVLLLKCYKKYHKILKNELRSDFDIDDPVWMKCKHLTELELYFRDYSSYNTDLMRFEESKYQNIEALNIEHGTKSPKIPDEISSVITTAKSNISNFISSNIDKGHQYLNDFRYLIYRPEYYKLSLNDYDEICLNGIPIPSPKTQLDSIPNKMIRTIFNKDNAYNYFEFDVVSEKSFAGFFSHLKLDKDYQRAFFPNSRLSANKIYFRPKVMRDEIDDPAILARFDKFLEESGAPATRIERECNQNTEIDLSDIPF